MVFFVVNFSKQSQLLSFTAFHFNIRRIILNIELLQIELFFKITVKGFFLFFFNNTFSKTIFCNAIYYQSAEMTTCNIQTNVKSSNDKISVFI